MRLALEVSSAPRERQGTSFQEHLPAPVAGWNTRDSIVDLGPEFATVLDNWYPRFGEVQQRGGSLDWATGLAHGVETLAVYNPTGGTNKLYAITDDGVFDATAGGAFGATVKAVTNGTCSPVNITNSAGTSFLWLCNGTDVPFYFNGAAWSNTALTGIATPANLIYAWLHKHRIWAIEKNTMNLWFLGLDSVTGAVQQFPVGNLMRRGGYLVSGTSWTLDSGDGPDDLLAAISSEGEVIVYKGTDPTSASSWGIVGVYFVGRPLGNRCFTKLAGDVAVLTENGVFPLSQVLQTGSLNYKSAYTNKIQPTVTDSTSDSGITTFGWEACVYPAFDALIINVPSGSFNSNQRQWVMNTITGALCSFSGWAAQTFAVMNGQLYFGTAGGKVLKAWDAAGAITSDNGSDIMATVHQAPTFFGREEMLKQISLFRLLTAYDGTVQFSWGVSVDYATTLLTSTILRALSVGSGATWDVSPWDTSSWVSATTRYKTWRSSSHFPGYALALWLQTANNNGKLTWAGSDFILKPAGAR
jgi:hypothetical protein